MSIYSKLTAIQNELKAPKNQYNSFGKYNYRNCEDILEAVKPILKKNACALHVEDSIECIGERFYVKATAYLYDCETGEYINSTAYAREEEAKKGMDASQVTGATSSYARKYCLNGLLLIDDTKDADSMDNTTPAAKPAPKATKKTAPQPISQATQNHICANCNNPVIDAGGAKAEDIAKATIQKYGKPYCKACIDAMKQKQKEETEKRITEAFSNMDVPFEIS